MKRFLNQSEYAAHRGVSQPRISKLIRQGKLQGAIRYEGRRTLIDWKKANEILKKTLDPSRKTKAEQVSKGEKESVAGEGKTIGLGFHQSKSLSEQYRAALLKLEYEAKSGKYVLRSDVESNATRVGKMIRTAIEGIGNKVAPVLVDMVTPAAIADVINREVNQILINLADEIKRM